MPVAIKYCAKQLHDLWDGGASYAEIAAVLGCSHSYVHDLKVRHNLPNRRRPTKEIYESDPTPDDIERMKAEIRERHLAEMRATG
jgi:hypothetical protein